MAVVLILAAGCAPEPGPVVSPLTLQLAATPTPTAPVDAPAGPIEPFPTRPPYQPGELVDYTAQTGDLLPALAARFNTTVAEIRAANPIIPDSATTMPPGMPMKIPIYYRPLWGSPYQILPDSLFVNGPAQSGFSAQDFVAHSPGWLKDYVAYANGENKRGGAIVDFVAEEYSISPRLLLAITEYMTGGLSQPQPPDPSDPYLLGKADYRKEGYYRQLAWLADTLNNGYYRWRTGELLELQLRDGRIERPDPWQNAATVALQAYFAQLLSPEEYYRAISAEGLAKTYAQLFGDPWANVQPHIPGSLAQPTFSLPFQPGKSWAFTGGPHSAWGEDVQPLAALDFAPPAVVGGCKSTEEWATAIADGIIARTGTGIAVLDLDGDGDERTGWVVFYLHLDTTTIPPRGTHLNQGDPIGRPSCDGGKSTGTHVHIARKYNGEWILADGVLAFNLEGWLAQKGQVPYQGTLTRNNRTVSACTCSDQASQIQAQGPALIQP